MHAENKSLGPTPGPVNLNHWKSEFFLTTHYLDQGSLGNTPIVLQLIWKIEIWGLGSPCLEKRNSLLYRARHGGVNYPSRTIIGRFYI